jgi:hypothetical protein
MGVSQSFFFWALVPIILTTWEAEIDRSWFEASKKNFGRPPSQPIAGCSGAHLSCQAMQESEIWKIIVSGQPGQKKFARPHLSGKRLDVVLHTCHPSHGKKQSRPAWTRSKILFPKQPKQKSWRSDFRWQSTCLAIISP